MRWELRCTGRCRDAITADYGFHAVLLRAAGDPDLDVSVALPAPRLRRMDLWLVARRAFDEPRSTHPAIIAAAVERGGSEAVEPSAP